MDFLRTLLLYMTSTLVIAVESTSAPVATPVPTPTPTPSAVVIEETATPLWEPEVTPAPTVSVTPQPVPTITPNTRAYHNLQQGDRGADVRRLQEKLIELGYLPEGAADGAYGGQTRTAVRRFQYYNGLTQDGVAGRTTQTNLFENPDVMPYPTPTPVPAPDETPASEIPTPEAADALTEAPTEALTEAPTAAPTEEMTAAPTEELTEEPTEEPTEAPTEEPTEAPTEEPTETPTEKPTEEPTEAPTEEPTEEPTEAPTEEPTEAPTEEPTEAPTEEPTEAPTEEPTEAPTEEPTEAPTEAPTPEEIIENVDLDTVIEEVQGSIVLNDSGAPMEWIQTEDGVPVRHTPRLQRMGDRLRMSLDDVAACLEDWTLTDDGATVVLEAMGYTLGFYQETSGIAATVDGTEIALDAADFSFEEGHFISAEFLASALSGEAIWDEEEHTLMLRIIPRELANASD